MLSPQQRQDLEILREIKADADSLGESLDTESSKELDELEMLAKDEESD